LCRFGIFWEIAGTEGTIHNSGERFNELQIFRMGERSAIGDSKPSIVAHECPSTPDSLASILPEMGLAILTCE
jgi:hypothetical protein